MATRMRVLALTLWAVTLACFAVGWLRTNRTASAAGCSTLVLYVVVVARARSLSSTSANQAAAPREH